MSINKRKPWVVRLGKGVYKDVILHRAVTKDVAEKFAEHYKQVHQRDPILKLVGISVIDFSKR